MRNIANPTANLFFKKALTLLLISTVGFQLSSCSSEQNSPQQKTKNIAELIPNIWYKYADGKNTDWQRVRHGGVAFDHKRQKIYFFGSDTHDTTPYNLDNTIHEFDIHTKEWSRHYPPAPLSTYRTDKNGYAIAGLTNIQPWAMHSFDNILYDPTLDAIVLTAVPRHNKLAQEAVPAVKQHPTWLYDLKTRQWYIMKNSAQPNPTFFAAASAYDSHRDTLVAYSKYGLWEIGPDRQVWRQATKEKHHEIHFSMEYDTSNQLFAVFGDYRGSSDIWLYYPGLLPGTPGQWSKKTPEGERLPYSEHYPVAYDSKRGLFLLVVNNQFIDTKSKRKSSVDAALTFTYNAKTNKLVQLTQTSLDPIQMNYNMIYSEFYDAFFLITGSDKQPLTIWILKLGN